MRFMGFAALAVWAVTACGGAPPAGSDPEAVVEALYQPYVSNAATVPALENAAPWTEDLRAMLVHTADHVDGGLGFDPLIDGQDYEITDLQVSTAEGPAEGQTVVDAQFTNFEDKVTVSFDFVEAEDGWRIADVHTEEWTLRGVLASAGVTPASAAAASGE